MTINEILDQAKEKMKKSVGVLEHEFTLIRAGRANPALLDRIMVDYYGTPTPIQQMAGISVSEARILVVQPWDKTTIGEIEKAIQKSDIGINPSNDGNVIRIAFPQPTEERRKELAKEVKKTAEEAKVAIRSIRRDANDLLKKLKDVSEDDVKAGEKDVQNLTDKFTKEIDQMTGEKEKEVMTL